MRHVADLFPLAGAAFFLAAAGFMIWRDATGSGRSGTRRAPELQLRVVEQNGRIRIDWDPSDPAVRSAQSATLVAEDGRNSEEYTVSGDALRGGGLDYLRGSNDVLLKLRMEGTGAEASVRAVAAPAAASPPAQAAKPPGDARARGR